ncbi:family 78 glycoside hydrolase catalytic domain [Nocardioides lijunqiniae]|uniref:family 78 glycoside hydrolase catalytic domain n=1 Tax=Nocardioides lijunqiniae TaxID=2760832 RepID=UPI001877FB13|nr:family 78 glycoside hydrolase catalytic domain [Nocardioides lijunqiniae]
MLPAPSHRLRSLVSGLALTLSLGVVAPIALGAPAAHAAEPLSVGHLTANGRVDPLGIPGAAPTLGWVSESTARGVVQSAYQVRVASSEDALGQPDVWDSGKVDSARQVDVAYAGPALTSGTEYVWQVRVWDGAGEQSAWSAPATFETGLLEPADWGDAAWVGKPAGTEVDRWTDYTVDFDFDIDNLVFGAFVRAGTTGNAYMWQLSVADGTPRFRPHLRVNGNYSLMANKSIADVVSAADLLDGEHTMSVTFDGPTITTKLDGTTIDTRTDPTFDRGFVGFRFDQANEGTEQATVHEVTVTAENGDVLLDTDFTDGNPFDGGTLVPEGLQLKGRLDALWRSPDANRPLLRKEFATEAGKTVASARVYASAHGIYELNLNGEKVGDQLLAPGWTDYRKRIQAQTYDVTELVRSGENAFGAELADGWWAGKVGMWGPDMYGDQLALVARLRIDYTDGTSEWVDTDDTWTSHYGPYVFTDNIDGETYDARAEQTGWEQPEFDDAGWADVAVVASDTAKLVPQRDDPVRVTEELATVERTEPTPGAFVYDLGQNMVGGARMQLSGVAGQTVTIRYGEMLNPDGTLYTANLRAAKVTDRYTFATTGTVTYEPKFTQHGFRYVEIVGAATPPAAADVTGVVWGSDLAATGTLETSDAMLNQLTSNISWGQRGNFLSIPTDTPARDERLGWTGDINVFAPTASYLRDTRAFLGKWMVDLQDSARENGNFHGIAPVPPGIDLGSGLGWSDAAVTVPYAVWLAHGDTAIVRDNYVAMEKFLRFTQDGAGADLIDTARGNWDDWLNLNDNTPTSVLGTAYLAENARMMSEMAAGIGEDADAAEFAQLSADVRAAFADTLVQPDGTVDGNSQTAYAMALGMDLVPDAALREKVAARFVAKLAASDNHLTTGFLGTPWLLPALSSIGRDDLAYTLLMHEDYPSWGYEVAKGATTMWERWDSIKPDGTFGDVGMNSFNHYAYGAVGDWMYQNIGGIKALEPGYRKIRVAPVVGGGLTHGGGEMESVYGTIATDWRIEGEDLSLTVDVPVNTTAEIVVPADSAWAVTESGTLLDQAEGVTEVTSEPGHVTVSVGSGHYELAVTAGNAELGAILEAVDGLKGHVGDLAEAGDLAAGDRAQLDEGLSAAHDDVAEALLARLAGDDDAATPALRSALTEVRDLRTWLTGSAVAAPVEADLDSRLAAIENQLVLAVTSALGFSVTLPPVSGAVLPGGEVTGTLEVANTAASGITDLTGTVTVEGWDPVEISAAGVPAGQSVQLPVTVAVPRHQAPGAYDAALSLTFALGGETFTVEDTTAGWATVTSGLEIGDVVAELGAGEPTERATLDVPVSNTGASDVRARVVATLPDGWASVPSPEVLVPAGGSVVATVPVVVPLDRVAGSMPVTVSVRRAGATLASRDTTATLGLATPPSGGVVDHVDFGNGASETAHGLQASASSGTNVEAGLTRRYANSASPGSWYSVLVDVPAGQPFVLRNIETFDGARTKKYHVYVDDVLVKTQLVPRTEGGAGTKVYDALVDDPSVLAADGDVRVRFEYPTDASGFFDPSIADLWVLPVPADAQAPDVSAAVSSGTVGDDGWYRSDVLVQVDSADNRDATPTVETGADAGWQAYVGPVPVTGDGKRELTFRGRDAAGNTSAVGALPVWIDTVAPTTQLAVTQRPGVEFSDRATLVFSAQDATSGVGRTAYRVDGGEWQVAGEAPITVTGYGPHLVDFASTDVAGNPEAVRQETVTLADVETVAALVAPQVTGPARVGSTLASTTGSWNTKGLALARQWLRNGTPIAGATGPTYRVGAADVGRRLSVRVTATKAGKAPGVSTSTATAPVARATSSTKVSTNRTKVGRGKPLRVTVKVTSSPTATGTVAVKVDGKVVRRVAVRNGKAVVTVKIAKRGRHKVSATYGGSATVAPSTSAVRVVKVT